MICRTMPAFSDSRPLRYCFGVIGSDYSAARAGAIAEVGAAFQVTGSAESERAYGRKKQQGKQPRTFLLRRRHGDGPAKRPAKQMASFDAQGIEQSEQVFDPITGACAGIDQRPFSMTISAQVGEDKIEVLLQIRSER